MKIYHFFLLYFFSLFFTTTCFCEDNITPEIHHHPYYERKEKIKAETYDTMLKVFTLSPLSGTFQEALIFLGLVAGAVFFYRKIEYSKNTGNNYTNMKFYHAFKWGALIHWFIINPLYTFIKMYMKSWDVSDNLEKVI